MNNKHRYALIRALCPELSVRQAAKRAGYASTPPPGARKLGEKLAEVQVPAPTADKELERLNELACEVREKLEDIELTRRALNLLRSYRSGNIALHEKDLQGCEAAS
jgi:hypothetical protein